MQADGVAAHWNTLCYAVIHGIAAQRDTSVMPRLASATSETHSVMPASIMEKNRPQFQSKIFSVLLIDGSLCL